MTFVERSLGVLRPFLGDQLAERLRANLPSRKPQLWENLTHVIAQRGQVAFGNRVPTAPLLLTLPRYNIKMKCSPLEQLTDRALLHFGVYEIAGTRFVENSLRVGDTFIDVGANRGYYSLLAARLVGPAGQVHAFEPVQGPFATLTANIRLNGLSNIDCHQTAVGGHDGITTIYSSAIADNDGLGSVIPGPGRAHKGEEVEMVTLDSFTSKVRLNQVSLIKVDVEGAEGDVFSGGSQILRRDSAPMLLFESFEIAPIASMLVKFGYQVRHLHYTLQRGLQFPAVGEAFDLSYAVDEAPNFVAIKPANGSLTFTEITERSRQRTSRLLRLLAHVA